jgi:hypothetical protein
MLRSGSFIDTGALTPAADASAISSLQKKKSLQPLAALRE